MRNIKQAVETLFFFIVLGACIGLSNHAKMTEAERREAEFNSWLKHVFG